MKPKTLKIIYWSITTLFALAMLASGIQELLQSEGSKEVMKLLGYPGYLNLILGAAKVLGVLAILQNRFTTLKEWAYAGFAIDFVGASASSALAAAGPAMIIGPIIFLAVMFISYYFWKTVTHLRSDIQEANYGDSK